MTLSSSIIKTKLRPPVPGDDIIARPRLLEGLRRSRNRALTIICAPAGSGKSTLMAQWLQEETRPVAWISLDAGESRLDAFLAYVLAALQGVFPNSCANLQGLVQAVVPLSAEQVATQLINDISDLPSDFILVLEDYHVVRDVEVHRTVDRLLRHRPHQLHLVISTRTEPPLALNVWRAQGQVVEIRQGDLRFRRDEVRAFLSGSLAVTPSEEALTHVEQRTEGWAAGLRLTALSVQAGDDLDVLARQLYDSPRHITGYLTDEIVTRQTPEIQRFLLRTSILERMSAPLCAALMEPEDEGSAAAHLAWLQESNLFLIPLDGDHTWYRYHHLFRETLLTRLHATTDAPAVAELHRRAARWFAVQGLVDEAMDHAIACGDHHAAARIAEENVTAVLNRMDRRQLDGWLARLPLEIIESRVESLLMRAWSLYWSMREGMIPGLLVQVRNLLSQVPPERQAIVQTQINVFDGLVAWNTAQVERAVAASLAAYGSLSPDQLFLRGITFLYTYSGMQMAGRSAEARAAAELALSRIPDTFDAYTLRVSMTSMFIAFMEGGMDELARMGQYGLVQSKRSRTSLGVGWSHYALGAAALLGYRNEAARQHYAAILEQPHAMHLRIVFDAYYAMAILLGERNEWQEADDLLEGAHAMVERMGAPPLVDEVRSSRARLALLRGDIDRARHLLPQRHSPLVRPRPLLSIETPELTTARVLIASGRREELAEAEELLNALLAFARRLHCVRVEIEAQVIHALLCTRQKREDAATTSLTMALRSAAERGILRPFVEMGRPLLPLLRQLHARGTAPTLLPAILELLPEGDKPTPQPGLQRLQPLTNRELDVLELLAQRMSNKEIAEQLVVAPNTIRTHLSNLFEKLGAEGRRDAVIKARSYGLIP